MRIIHSRGSTALCRASLSLPLRLPQRFIPTCSSTRVHSTTASTVPPAPYNILFCGTDSFASRSLSALISNAHLVSALHVLTPPDVTQKWGAARMKVAPVKQLALTHQLPHQDVPAGGMETYTLPSAFPMNERSILLTCSFGHLIPDTLLDAFANPWQRINIHPSLLPQLRGAAPIQWALASKLTRSGVSIQTLEKGKFDTGTIVAQAAFDFPPPLPNDSSVSFLEVEKVMAERAADLLVKTLTDLSRHWSRSWAQDEGEKTFAPKLKASHSAIKWDKWTAEDVVARDRGFAYLYQLTTTLIPAAGTSFKPVAVTLSDISIILHTELDQTTAMTLLAPSLAPGSATFCPTLDALIVKTHQTEPHKQTLLAVKTIKVASKKPKPAREWYRAYRDRATCSGILTFR